MRRSLFAGDKLTPYEQWRKSLKRWLVISPKYDNVIPVLDDGSGPTEPTCDMIEVDAKNKKDALLFGIKIMRKNFRDGWHNSDPGENPFKGMQIEEWLEEYDEALEDYGDIMIPTSEEKDRQERVDAEATY